LQQKQPATADWVVSQTQVGSHGLCTLLVSLAVIGTWQQPAHKQQTLASASTQHKQQNITRGNTCKLTTQGEDCALCVSRQQRLCSMQHAALVLLLILLLL
jgi:hypothetical protein